MNFTEHELLVLLTALEYKRVQDGLGMFEFRVYRKLADEYKASVDQFTTPQEK